MIVYLDDVRMTGQRSRNPRIFTHRTYTAPETIALLRTGQVTHVSLDHDLDGDGTLPEAECGTGYDVACWIEEAAATGAIPRLTWEIHSMNPSGASRMRAALESADRYWVGVDNNNIKDHNENKSE